MTDRDRQETDAFERMLPDKYELDDDPESGAIIVHRRDGSPIARYHPERRHFSTDIVVDLTFADDVSDEEQRQLGERALESVIEPWRGQGFEVNDRMLTRAEDSDGAETPIYAATLKQSVDGPEAAVDLVEWLVRRDHFHYGDEVLD